MAKKELLTGEQRENILELNQLSEFEFASYYSLSDDDIDCSGQAKWEHYDPKKLNLA